MPYSEGRTKDYTQLQANKWYHGTTMSDAENIKKNGVIVNKNLGIELDFGYGFYLTPNKKQAEKYIKDKVTAGYNNDLGLISLNKDNTPVVLEFEFPYSPFNFFEKEKTEFGFLPHYDDRFAEFIFHNRYYNVNGDAHHNYDMIYGVMSDSIPVILLQQYRNGEVDKEYVIENLKKSTSAKQLSIHNQSICDKLILKETYIVELEV